MAANSTSTSSTSTSRFGLSTAQPATTQPDQDGHVDYIPRTMSMAREIGWLVGCWLVIVSFIRSFTTTSTAGGWRGSKLPPARLSQQPRLPWFTWLAGWLVGWLADRTGSQWTRTENKNLGRARDSKRQDEYVARIPLNPRLRINLANKQVKVCDGSASHGAALNNRQATINQPTNQRPADRPACNPL